MAKWELLVLAPCADRVVDIVDLVIIRRLHIGDIHKVKLKVVYKPLQYVMHSIPGTVRKVGLKVLWEKICIQRIPGCLGYRDHCSAVLLVKLLVKLIEPHEKKGCTQQNAGTHHYSQNL